jgi:pyruvate formate lyase activating enzyme
MREIVKDKAFYEASGGGVTFSGGECMLQIDFLEEILKECKKNGIHTAVDTAGHVPYERFEQILTYTDLFLYDVKCFDSEKHRQYAGVGNGLILENLKKLLAKSTPVWIRIPIIPTVNDTEEELQRIKEYLSSCGIPEKVELLPYHAMGEHKYAAIGKETQIFSVPGEEKMKHLKNIFS